jgi:L-ascorbate metabolism protein UlaG (beta-lactamase superfamily)
MVPWDEVTLGALTITAVPAQHGPDGTEHLTGPVTGFVLRADDLPTVAPAFERAGRTVLHRPRHGEVVTLP